MFELPPRKRVRVTEKGLARLREAQNTKSQELGKHLSYEAIAEEAYVHRSTISRLFTGKKIDLDNVRAILKVLDIEDWEELLG